MKLIPIRLIEILATDVLTSPFKLEFTSGALLTPYASLRCSDVQCLSTFDVNDAFIFGGILV